MTRLVITFLTLFFADSLARASNSSDVNADILVQLSARTDKKLPLIVRPLERFKKVKRDLPTRVIFRFANMSDETLHIKAIHQLHPYESEQHFHKLVCFCFEGQSIGPRETRDMPLVFTLDRTLPGEISAIKLEYVVFENNRLSKTQVNGSATQTK